MLATRARVMLAVGTASLHCFGSLLLTWRGHAHGGHLVHAGLSRRAPRDDRSANSAAGYASNCPH